MTIAVTENRPNAVSRSMGRVQRYPASRARSHSSTGRRVVIAVPRAGAFERNIAAQRDAVVDPVFQRDKAARRLARRVEPGEAGELPLGEKRVERREQGLDE